MKRAVVVGVVITGATGFVGGELLKTVLEETTRNVICPVRAESDEAASERGIKRLNELFGQSNATHVADRVEWVRADIEERNLGWTPTQWRAIASRTDEIYHCAASVSFDLPLHEAHRINVDGTKHVFQLGQAAAAHSDRFQRFHHVSTAYVAGLASGRVDSNFLPSDRARYFRNSYEQTKARAERFLRAAATEQVPVSIYRPSIIAGNSKTGATTNWNVLYMPMKMVARGSAPLFPRGGRELLDTVAVDFLVHAMMIFTQLDARTVESHHITAGSTAFTVTDVLEETVTQARLRGLTPSQTKLVGPMLWPLVIAAIEVAACLPRRMRKVRVKARAARRAMKQYGPYLEYGNVDVIFDAAKDHDLMRVFGVEMPAGPQYLQTVVSYALNTNFGRHTDRSAAAFASRS